MWIALVPRGVLGKGSKNEKACLDYGDLDCGWNGALVTVLLGTCGP